MDEIDLGDLERRTRDLVAGDLRAALTALSNTVAAVYIAAAGDTRHALDPRAQQTLRNHLTATLSGLAAYDYADTRRTLVDAARAAMAGGARDLGVDVGETLPLDVRQALTGLTAGMRADLRAALNLARHGPLDRYGAAQAVVGMARKALNRADSTAVWTVHRAHNEGRSRAVDKLAGYGENVVLMWRAERGACVFCLSLAGALAAPGEPFQPVVDVADASQVPDFPLFAPPAHPWCRCAAEPWYGAAEADLEAVDLPMALRREAQRSLATGSAKASNPARVRAAGRLLGLADLLIPKTVQRRARKAVDSGAFPS